MHRLTRVQWTTSSKIRPCVVSGYQAVSRCSYCQYWIFVVFQLAFCRYRSAGNAAWYCVENWSFKTPESTGVSETALSRRSPGEMFPVNSPRTNQTYATWRASNQKRLPFQSIAEYFGKAPGDSWKRLAICHAWQGWAEPDIEDVPLYNLN